MEKRDKQNQAAIQKRFKRYENFCCFLKFSTFALPILAFIFVTIIFFQAVTVPIKGKDTEIACMTDIAIDVYEQKLNNVALIYVPDGYSFRFTDTEIIVSSNQYTGSVTLKLKESENNSVINASNLTANDFIISVDNGVAFTLFLDGLVGAVCGLVLYLILEAIYLFVDGKLQYL